jgi:hypothetical protein
MKSDLRPDANKIAGVSLTFGLQGSKTAGQEDFQDQLNANASVALPSHTFHVSITIPSNIASGTYKIIQASAGEPDVGGIYKGTELPNLTVRIDNPRTFSKPKLTITPLP